MKIEVLLERNSNIIVHENVYTSTDDGVFIVNDCDNDDTVALYPVRNVSSITFLD